MGLRGKKEEKKINGGERGGLYTRGRRREMKEGGLVGKGKRDGGGYVYKFNWVWEICRERKKIIG